ncbi:MAG: hypothetical protein Q9207_002232 [Kuettlingeria erythrocarpa]
MSGEPGLGYRKLPSKGLTEWHRYKQIKFNGSEDKMQKYTTLMNTYGQQVGIDFDFHGTVANTFDAHRLIQHYQEELGAEVADEIVNSLYTQYFTQRAHPSAPETLVKAATAAGVDKAKAEAFVSGESEGMQETKMLLREQANNGIDSVSTFSSAPSSSASATVISTSPSLKTKPFVAPLRHTSAPVE